MHIPTMSRLSNILLVLAVAIFTADAFTPPRTSLAVVRCNTKLYALEDDEQVGLPPLPSQRKVEDPAMAVERMKEEWTEPSDSSGAGEQEGTQYPINLPSPALLGMSMVMAISAIGSLFELTGGAETKLGFAGTAALAAIGAPLSIFLMYAAILKGTAETEEDDKLYNSPRKLR